MESLYYFNKFQDRIELVKENIESKESIDRIINFYYDTSMNISYGNIEQVKEEVDLSGWPEDVKKVYYAEVESKEKPYFIFLITTASYADYYNSFSMASPTPSSTIRPTYDWEC